MTEEETFEYRRLESLNDSDYEIADGDLEIQGWEIKADHGARIGIVSDLLFNPSTKKVRYLVADLDGGLYSALKHSILIPIGLATLHETADEVLLPGITVAQLQAVPGFSEGAVEQQYELAVLNAFRNNVVSEANAEIYEENNFYAHPNFNDQVFYQKRFPDRNVID